MYLALVTECKASDALQGRSTQSPVMPPAIAAETMLPTFLALQLAIHEAAHPAVIPT